MERRAFLTRSAGALALGAIGCSNDKSPMGASAGKSVTGKIADPDGNGIHNVLLTLSNGERVKTAYTGREGAYTFNGVADGEYTLEMRKSGFSFNPSSQKVSIRDNKSMIVNVVGIILNTVAGEIQMNRLGTTDLMVSKFSFGSHILSAYQKDYQLRDLMTREAFDRGIKTFDVYDEMAPDNTGYANMGRYLAPVINDVVISTYINNTSKTPEADVDKMLKAFNRDHIDMVRNLIWDKTGEFWGNWDKLFALKDKGKVRAVGVSVHAVGIGQNITDGSPLQNDIKDVLEAYADDLDYVIFPFNFYHNIGWPLEWYPEGFIPLAQTLREKGIGIVTMKPFAGEAFTDTLNQAAKTINPDLSFSNAALRYILNSGLEPDMSLVGMNTMSELKENFNAFYKPSISADEEKFLEDIRGVAAKAAPKILPEHYKFLQSWAPETYGPVSYATV